MEIAGVFWLKDIVEKLATKHQVEQDEVREVLDNSPKFRYIEKGHQAGENVYSAAGQTDSGRYLIIYFIYKRNRWALIVSARDMTRPERRQYEQK